MRDRKRVRRSVGSGGYIVTVLPFGILGELWIIWVPLTTFRSKKSRWIDKRLRNANLPIVLFRRGACVCCGGVRLILMFRARNYLIHKRL